jgi:LmbE family N-acetylglucosaminyl deacetylase
MSKTGGLLIAIAHPDDESFGMGGTMAEAAAEGRPVTMVCATRGEVGEIADPALATPETLGAVREQELRDACAALGVQDVRFLDYRDSGMEGTPENADLRALCNAPDEAVAAAFAAIMRQVRPAVVVTWDPSGGYGHPDHLAVHRGATLAFEQVAAESGGPGSLYYMALPVHLWGEMMSELRAQGIKWGDEDDSIGERVAQLTHLAPTTEIDVAAHTQAKLDAARQHRTQLPPELPWDRISPDLRHRMVDIEYFTRIVPAWHDGDPTERAFPMQER